MSWDIGLVIRSCLWCRRTQLDPRRRIIALTVVSKPSLCVPTTMIDLSHLAYPLSPYPAVPSWLDASHVRVSESGSTFRPALSFPRGRTQIRVRLGMVLPAIRVAWTDVYLPCPLAGCTLAPSPSGRPQARLDKCTPFDWQRCPLARWLLVMAGHWWQRLPVRLSDGARSHGPSVLTQMSIGS